MGCNTSEAQLPTVRNPLHFTPFPHLLTIIRYSQDKPFNLLAYARLSPGFRLHEAVALFIGGAGVAVRRDGSPKHMEASGPREICNKKSEIFEEDYYWGSCVTEVR